MLYGACDAIIIMIGFSLRLRVSAVQAFSFMMQKEHLTINLCHLNSVETPALVNTN